MWNRIVELGSRRCRSRIPFTVSAPSGHFQVKPLTVRRVKAGRTRWLNRVQRSRRVLVELSAPHGSVTAAYPHLFRLAWVLAGPRASNGGRSGCGVAFSSESARCWWSSPYNSWRRLFSCPLIRLDILWARLDPCFMLPGGLVCFFCVRARGRL